MSHPPIFIAGMGRVLGMGVYFGVGLLGVEELRIIPRLVRASRAGKVV